MKQLIFILYLNQHMERLKFFIFRKIIMISHVLKHERNKLKLFLLKIRMIIKIETDRLKKTLVVSVFANGPGDLGSIPGRVIPKTQKWYLMPPCLTLSNIRYVSRVKWSNPGKGVAPSPTPWCISYWEGSLLVVLDYGRQLYLFILTRL